MKPAPAPLIIEKGRQRILFNEPHEQGCVTIELDSGSISIFLDDIELEKLSRATWKAFQRIRANRRAAGSSVG
jgi:hypothetical protein